MGYPSLCKSETFRPIVEFTVDCDQKNGGFRLE
ncbi:hypothetical protein R75461_08335 [Paraburkholderia nemoris]|nr:hypothetical protein R75461_08335 [Paraburkholderia nemoris]